MKKFKLLLMLTLVTSCGNQTSEYSIAAPTGAPAIAFYDQAENPSFETYSNPSNIVSLMTSASDKEFVVIDTVSGIKAIQKNAPYKLAANITFGNFFIATTGHDTNETLDELDNIVLFGKNQTPDYLFHYIYGNNFDNNIEWVDNVSDAAKCLATGKNFITGNDVDYVFIAQPVLYKMLNNTSAATYGKSKIYVNIHELYKEKSSGKELVQASVFVKNSVAKERADSFLSSLESKIQNAIANPSIISDGMNKIPSEEALSLFGIESNIVLKVMESNEVGLGYKKAITNIEQINSYISLFGMEATNEEIYFK